MIGRLPADIVLVVDDSPESVRLLTDMLEGEGMTVVFAIDGIAALKAAAESRPDIVLMDAVMPMMDGFETCRRIKTLSGFENVPVIFMTGLSDPEDSARGFEAGGADYVTKPIVIDDILARMRVHLSNARKIQSARMALDAADQFLVATNREGAILWFTPQAYRLLEERFWDRSSDELRLSRQVLAWLRSRMAAGASSDLAANETIFSNNGLSSRIRFVGEAERGEILFRISNASSSDQLANVRLRFNLTQRETEVLSWIVKGKTNRDIAAILALSHRTVDKHVEGVLAKLNVENRMAAALLIMSMK